MIDIGSIVSGAVGGGVAGIIIVITRHVFEKKESIRKKREYLYGRLWGLNNALPRIYQSHLRAHLNFQSAEEQHRKFPKKTAIEEEMRYWQRFCETSYLRLEDKLAEFHEVLGLISVTFDQESDLKELVERCSKLKTVPDKVIGKPKNMKSEIDKLREYLHNCLK